MYLLHNRVVIVVGKSKNCSVLHSKFRVCVYTGNTVYNFCILTLPLGSWYKRRVKQRWAGRKGRKDKARWEWEVCVGLWRYCEFNFEAVSICVRQQMVCRRRVTADQWTPDWFCLYLDFFTPGIKRHSRPISTHSRLTADQRGAHCCSLIWINY